HVVLTQDWHPPGHRSFASSHRGKRPFETVTVDYGEQILWPDHCVQGTPGAQFHNGLQIPHAELVLRKGFRPTIDSYSAFYETDRRTGTALPVICTSGASPASSPRVSRSISAYATRPRTRAARALPWS